MKSLRYLILFLILYSVARAALTKTTSIVEVDAWQSVGAGTLDVGAAGDISGSYNTILYLEIAYADTAAQDGVDVTVEVSYGDDNWTLLSSFTTPSGGTLISTQLSGEELEGQTVVELNDMTDFADLGLKWFIEDDDGDEDSESVRTKAISGSNLTLCHDTLRGHDYTDNCWGIVHERIIPIPATFAYVRVLINNTDADADVFYTTRISKVTAL